MPKWRDRSANFQRNMRQLSAADDFGDDDASDYKPPEVFNPWATQAEAIPVLKELVEGLESGRLVMDTCSFSMVSDPLTAQIYRGPISAVARGTSVVVNMTVRPNPNVTLPDDYPELGDGPRAAVGAAPPRDLILDDDDSR